MTALLVADIHLNDNPRDEYRWGLLEEFMPRHQEDEIIILGDLTDSKNRHDAKLVNRLHDAILNLAEASRVVVLKGNHDYSSSENPFFRFIGSHNGVEYVSELRRMKLSVGSTLFVPAGEKWDFEIPDVDYIFTHATFSGAKAENGTTLTGVDPRALADFEGKVWSGDIHTQQRIGRRIEYVGAPYHTKFGDQYEPRLVRLDDDGRSTDLHFPALRKLVIDITRPEDLNEAAVSVGDQVKVRCHLRRADRQEWRKYREDIGKIANAGGWLLCGAEMHAVETGKAKSSDAAAEQVLAPAGMVEDYAQRHRASREHVRIGRELLD